MRADELQSTVYFDFTASYVMVNARAAARARVLI